MMSSSEDVATVIKSLLESQRFAVLAKDDQAQPYLFLMAFASTICAIVRVRVRSYKVVRKF